MSTRLLQTIVFGSIAAGATSALPHTLNINGTAIKPDLALIDVDGLTVVINTATVTITNNNPVAVVPTVFLERFHSLARQLGGGLDDMTPQPVVIQGSSITANDVASVLATGAVSAAGAFTASKGFNSVTLGIPGQYSLVLTDPPAVYANLVIVATLKDAASNGGQVTYTTPGTPNIAIQTFDKTGTLASTAFSIIVLDLT